MDYSKYLGTWVNTLKTGQTMIKFRLYEAQGNLMMETETTFSPKRWENIFLSTYGEEKDPGKFVAFEARYASEAIESLFCANENKGLMVIGGLHKVTSASGQKAYFTREFFVKSER